MVSNIWVAAADGQTDVVLQYIRSKSFSANSKDPNGYTPVHAAASYNHIDLLKVLIENGGDINIQDNEGDTPLHHTEEADVARFLVEELHADPKIKNAQGETAADYIEAEDEFPEVARYLRSLAHGEPQSSKSESSAVLENLPSPGNVDGHQVRYTMEEDMGDMDPEKRKQLEEIVNSENPEQALRELVTSAVREGLSEYHQNEDSSSKRARQ